MAATSHNDASLNPGTTSTPGQGGVEPMSKHFILACILLASVGSAQALECQASSPDGEGHWAWRLIEGRKCWYKGASGMDKSLLHWPAAQDSADLPDAAPGKTADKKTQASLEWRPIPPEFTQMLPVMPPEPTFEDRWLLH